MADVAEAEFWLPSDILMDNKENLNQNEEQLSSTTEFCFPTEFPYEFDDEDQLTHLTRQLSLPQPIPSQQNFKLKSWILSGSPQSTLVQYGSWSGRSPSTNGGSASNNPSQVISPLTTPLGVSNDGLDLIYQAAGHVAKLKMNDRDNRVLVGPRYRPAPLKNPTSALYKTYVQQAREEHLVKELQQRYGVWSNEEMKSGKSTRSSWTCMQQQFNKKQRNGQVGSMFLDGNEHVGGVKRKCAGTGVFLPRRYVNVSNPPPKNPGGCPTAPLSPRLVQARAQAQAQNNNNVNHFNCGLVQSHCHLHFKADPFLDYYDKLMMARREEAWLLQQRGNLGSLPHEWTY